MSDPLAPADPAAPEAGDRSPVSSADVDTQFDLDLSAELEQYPDPSWAPAAGTDPAAVPTEVAAAIDPPTSVHSVFVTPPAGTAVVVPPAPVPTPVAPPVGPGPRGGRRAGRRVLVGFGAVALAASLVAVGAGLALALSGADD
ncbi:MAG: hypothetical protein KDB10_22675, partial [Acidimicrobiales bacterium]|nr:hypothetical protein [Acidimicrobiales bacterium]